MCYYNLNFDVGDSNREIPNMTLLRKHLLREGPINKPELIEIISEAGKILSKLNLYYFNGMYP